MAIRLRGAQPGLDARQDDVDDLTDDVIVVHDLEQVLDVAWMGHSEQRHSMADAAHIAEFDPPRVLTLIDRVERAEVWTVAHPCQVSHEQPYDFRWCEAHDRTFPLDGDCDHKGKPAQDWQDAREQEQRMRAIRAEDRTDAADAEASRYRGLYDEAESARTAAEAKVARLRELASPDWCLSVPSGVKQAILDRLDGSA